MLIKYAGGEVNTKFENAVQAFVRNKKHALRIIEDHLMRMRLDACVLRSGSAQDPGAFQRPYRPVFRQSYDSERAAVVVCDDEPACRPDESQMHGIHTTGRRAAGLCSDSAVCIE
jgi:hypothetical protein